MGRHPGLELEVGEDDVLDPVLDVGLAPGRGLDRQLPSAQREDHRDVVGAEAPERVLVGADAAEVEPLPVDVADVPERALVDHLPQLADAGVVLEQVADHQDPVVLLGEGHDALGVGEVLGQGLLDEAVLAGLDHLLGDRGVGRDRGGDCHRVQVRVGEDLLDVGGEPGLGVDPLPLLAHGLVGVAEPGQLAALDRVEVAGQVRAPVADADLPDANRLSHGWARCSGSFRER